jgi:hypothetical protein
MSNKIIEPSFPLKVKEARKLSFQPYPNPPEDHAPQKPQEARRSPNGKPPSR